MRSFCVGVVVWEKELKTVPRYELTPEFVLISIFFCDNIGIILLYSYLKVFLLLQFALFSLLWFLEEKYLEIFMFPTQNMPPLLVMYSEVAQRCATQGSIQMICPIL